MPNILLGLTGTGVAKTTAHNKFNCISTIGYVEPLLLNSGDHPFQKDWYSSLEDFKKEIIDEYKNYTPTWSEDRLPWNVAELLIKKDELDQYKELGGKIGTDKILTMQKFLYSLDLAGIRKDVLQKMLFGLGTTTEASAFNTGIEIVQAIGYQPHTYFIDLEAKTNQQQIKFCKEQNNWSIRENKAVFIPVMGMNVKDVKLYEELQHKLPHVVFPNKFKNATAELLLNELCRVLHKEGYKVIIVSKGMAFKSNTVEYIDCVVHFRDGGSIDVRYQAGARGTTSGRRWDGTIYVQKKEAFEMFLNFANKPQASLLRQAIYQMQNETCQNINKKKPSKATPNFDPSLFFKTVTVGSNITGNFKWMNSSEAYSHCNTPEIVSNLISSQFMGTDLDSLSSDILDIITKMQNTIGSPKYVNTTRKGNNISGKTKPPGTGNKHNQPPKQKSGIRDTNEVFEKMFSICETILKTSDSIMALAEKQGLVVNPNNSNNWCFYNILENLNNHADITEMFGVSGKQIVKMLNAIKEQMPIVNEVTFNQLVKVKLSYDK